MTGTVILFPQRERATISSRNSALRTSIVRPKASPALGNKLQVLALTKPHALYDIEKLVDLEQPGRIMAMARSAAASSEIEPSVVRKVRQLHREHRFSANVIETLVDDLFVQHGRFGKLRGSSGNP